MLPLGATGVVGMMKLWLVSFMLCFLIAESLQGVAQVSWLQSFDLSFDLSLPLMILGGMVLAIASNQRPASPDQDIAAAAEPKQHNDSSTNTTRVEPGPPSSSDSSFLPSAAPPQSHRSQGSISFEIRRRPSPRA